MKAAVAAPNDIAELEREFKIMLQATNRSPRTVEAYMAGDYDWVECGSCEVGWQVPHYADSVG